MSTAAKSEVVVKQERQPIPWVLAFTERVEINLDSSQDEPPSAQPHPPDSRDGDLCGTQIANDFGDSDGEQHDDGNSRS